MRKLILILLTNLLALPIAFTQKPAKIKEEVRHLKTYPFSDPNPIPVLTTHDRVIYPYHDFHGFSFDSEMQPWKIVKMENDFIEVYVLPEVGGKVWGAIEKSTGKEFIYRNEVMKFRNIAMRGPWTSGGIEFNFGIIGHSPATATPVDYFIKTNLDGSVSCFVGNIDLPSRTKWTVEIRLPKDKAYFETNVVWQNPTDLPQSHYNFMTGAAVVSKDLEFIYPGDQKLEHEGKVHPWPINEMGVDMSKYANDTFGSHNSYHMVGEYEPFIGGYFKESKFGFGHWARYEDMPGRKLWLWSTARDGAIWEDLLTDTDGQYMEFQAGRSFTQNSYNAFKNPIKEMSFNGHVIDQWDEFWFPVKGIGGYKKVSRKGALNVERTPTGIDIGFNSFVFGNATLLVKSQGKTIFTKAFKATPMSVFQTSCALEASDTSYEVMIQNMDLHYEAMPTNKLKRNFVRSSPVVKNASYYFWEGEEMKTDRKYEEAKSLFQLCLANDATYPDALVGLSEIFYRQQFLDSAMIYAQKALELNTYHPAANYFAGLIYKANKDEINALESFGLAARSMEYRSVAYAQMAEIKATQKHWKEAVFYANKSLEFNQHQLSALKILSVNARKSNKLLSAKKLWEKIQTIDALDDFSRFEQYLVSPTNINKTAFTKNIQNEFPYQTYLELASEYLKLGLKEDALKVLELSPQHDLVAIWKAFLNESTSALDQIKNEKPYFIFPFRAEDVEVLKWAVKHNDHWTFKYYLGLVYWHLGRKQDAKDLFLHCGETPNFAPFYTSRAYLQQGEKIELVEKDFQKALAISPQEWRNWDKLIHHFASQDNNEAALKLSSEAIQKFDENFMLRIQHAGLLLDNGQYDACLNVLSNTKVLPFEGSIQGKQIYEVAHLYKAVEAIEKAQYEKAISEIEQSKAWPENLGSGRPYVPDERIQDYLTAFCLEKIGQKNNAYQAIKHIVELEQKWTLINPVNELISLIAFQKLNDDSGLKTKLNSIMTNPNYTDDDIGQWVIAKYNKDTLAVTHLESLLKSQRYISLLNTIFKITG
ncbi:MAG TPA: DUF5107 domain-containing protein [Saprospiraceae bacterium]|nr:DUF5107 domain-containing protein [Saprospiraceae bacterium]